MPKTRNTFCRTRSLSNATFSFFWLRDVHPVQNMLLRTNFHENPMIFHWDMTIYRFSKWWPSAILELFYHHTRPPTKFLLLAAAACQISCQCDTQIWRYSYLNFSHILLEMPIQAPKMGGLVDFGPLNVIIHHRDPQKAHFLRKSASFKLSTVNLVSELTESVTDGHTHTHNVQTHIHTDTHTGKFIFCPCIALDRQNFNNFSEFHFCSIGYIS